MAPDLPDGAVLPGTDTDACLAVATHSLHVLVYSSETTSRSFGNRRTSSSTAF